MKRIGRKRNYPKGQIIAYSEEAYPDMVLVAEGTVKAYSIDNQGNEKILHLLKAPVVVPLGNVLRPEAESNCFYAALTDVGAYLMPREKFSQCLARHDKVVKFLLKQASHEIHELMARVDSMNKTTTQARLIGGLKFLVAYHARPGRGSWCKVLFPVSHQMLADLCGVTRESVTLALQQLQQQHIVRYPKPTLLEINTTHLVNFTQ